MNPLRLVLLLSIAVVMIFALTALFVWPNLQSVIHYEGEYAIEEEEQSLRLGFRHRPTMDAQKLKAVAALVQAQKMAGDGVSVSEEYNVPNFPVVKGHYDYPLRSPQDGTIVYGRRGTVYDPSNPTKGLHDIDPKHLHGRNGIKEDGTLTWTPLPELDWKSETREDRIKRHDHTGFNVRRSDSLPMDRDIPDTRDPHCPTYDLATLPTTSVVFVFYNEPLSPLLRSIHSVLNRSPPELLKEIILIDDGSTSEWLGEELATSINYFPKTIVKRIKRSGLMVARTEGALIATADTVTFLDSHIEVRCGKFGLCSRGAVPYVNKCVNFFCWV
mgnify:CR=1 FL=1